MLLTTPDLLFPCLFTVRWHLTYNEYSYLSQKKNSSRQRQFNVLIWLKQSYPIKFHEILNSKTSRECSYTRILLEIFHVAIVSRNLSKISLGTAVYNQHQHHVSLISGFVPIGSCFRLFFGVHFFCVVYEITCIEVLGTFLGILFTCRVWKYVDRIVILL